MGLLHSCHLNALTCLGHTDADPQKALPMAPLRSDVLQLVVGYAGTKAGDCMACAFLAIWSRLRLSPTVDKVLIVKQTTATYFNIKTGEQEGESIWPPCRHDCAAVVCGGCLYTFGGKMDLGYGAHLDGSQVSRLDLEARTWTEMPRMPTRRRGAAAIEMEGCLYVIGGRNGPSNTRAVEKFDLRTEDWSVLPPLNHARAYCTAATALSTGPGAGPGARCIYVLGGSDELSVEKFDANMWEDFVQMPFQRDVGCVAVPVGHMIYVIGGCSAHGRRRIPRSDRVARLDLHSLEWTLLLPPPASHEYFSQAVELDGAIYVFGGSKEGPVSMFETWSGRWKALPETGLDPQGGGCYAAVLLPAVQHSVHRRHTNLTEESEDSVIQQIHHADPPQHIDPVEAAIFGEVQQAGYVERLNENGERVMEAATASHLPFSSDMSSQGTGQAGSEEIATPERVVILRFGSAPSAGDSTERFRQALLCGPELRPCREALEQAGHAFELLEGALVFVSPELYAPTMRGLVGTELRPYNVVIAETLEYLVEEILEKRSFKKRPRPKSPRQVLEMARSSACVHSDETINSSEAPEGDGTAGTQATGWPNPTPEGAEPESAADFAGAVQWSIIVSRTFVQVVPTLQDCCTVVQSSSELVGVLNPRRVG